MGLLPVPDEVKNRHDKIDLLPEAVNSPRILMGRALERTHESGSFKKDLRDLAVGMEHANNSITIIKDCIRFRQTGNLSQCVLQA